MQGATTVSQRGISPLARSTAAFFQGVRGASISSPPSDETLAATRAQRLKKMFPSAAPRAKFRTGIRSRCFGWSQDMLDLVDETTGDPTSRNRVAAWCPPQLTEPVTQAIAEVLRHERPVGTRLPLVANAAFSGTGQTTALLIGTYAALKAHPSMRAIYINF